jgi:hypothetical protein
VIGSLKIRRSTTICALLLIGFGLATIIVRVAPSATQQSSRHAGFSFLLRAGRNYQTLGALELRRRRDAVSFADAIRAFGKPSSCRVGQYTGTAVARWHSFGIRLRLATLGGLPRGKNGCTAPGAIYVNIAYVSGGRWHTPLGLEVGSSVDDLKSLYPTAIFQRRPLGVLWPAPTYWIVHVREHCVIGICRTRYQTVPRLAAHVKSRQVIEFFFPVGAQGE